MHVVTVCATREASLNPCTHKETQLFSLKMQPASVSDGKSLSACITYNHNII